MKEIDFNIYKLLKEEKGIPNSKITKSVKNSIVFENLIENGILIKNKKGRGIFVSIAKQQEFDIFFKKTFPSESNGYSKSANIKKYRDSKAKQIKNEPIFFIRGFKVSVRR